MPAGRFPVTGQAPSQYIIPTSGPVTRKEIYYLLLQQGYSTHQAIGLMANMMNESGLDPEAHALDSNGKMSYGLVQWNAGSYPNAHGLVTGNAQQDVRAQIKYLTQTVPRSALQGSTSGEVAGNVAQFFEKCQGCQPGGSQFNARVANANTIAGWVASGKWPTNATGQTQSGFGAPGSTSGGNQNNTPSTCLIQIPSVAGQGGGCGFSKTQARALIGGLLVIAGGGWIIIGLAIVVVGAFSHTKAGQAAGKAVGTAGEVAGAGLSLAGAPEVGAGVAAAGHGVKSGARHAQRKGVERRSRQVSEEKQLQRKVGEPRENRELRTGKGAIRETSQGRARRIANAKGDRREKVPF